MSAMRATLTDATPQPEPPLETTGQVLDLADGERLAFGPSDPTAAGWLLADMGCR